MLSALWTEWKFSAPNTWMGKGEKGKKKEKLFIRGGSVTK